MSVVQTRLFRRTGMFQPRLPELMLAEVTSLYDLAPLRANLQHFVDFDRLNSGKIRVSVVTTDIETGEEVVFDTGRGHWIGPDHLLASCGLLPDFPPVEIEGRLLGDGGFAANAPFETILLDEAAEVVGGDLLCFVVDLFCSEGSRPMNLEQAAARRWDLMFGNQSRQRLTTLEREFQLRWDLGHLASAAASSAPAGRTRRSVTHFHLAYCAPTDEAGPEKPFDFSRATLADRWAAGSRDMAEAVRLAEAVPQRSGVIVHRIPADRNDHL